ncbi:MAG: hypothetical protein ACOC7V_12225 [Spirochaetota bacterium]
MGAFDDLIPAGNAAARRSNRIRWLDEPDPAETMLADALLAADELPPDPGLPPVGLPERREASYVGNLARLFTSSTTRLLGDLLHSAAPFAGDYGGAHLRMAGKDIGSIGANVRAPNVERVAQMFGVAAE